MKRAWVYCAVLALGTLGLSGTAAARDNDHEHGHGQAHQSKHHDRDHGNWKSSHRANYHETARAHERREWAEKQREHRELVAHHHHATHHNNGKHVGWEKGKHNPHHDGD